MQTLWAVVPVSVLELSMALYCAIDNWEQTDLGRFPEGI